MAIGLQSDSVKLGEGLPGHRQHDQTKRLCRFKVSQSLIWLRTVVPEYWIQREALATILRYLAGLHIPHWQEDADAARLVAGSVENDHV